MSAALRERPFEALTPAQQAGILCRDRRFRAYVASVCVGGDAPMSAEAAAEYVRRVCKVRSRAALNREDFAASRWARLRTEFDAWRGVIPAPR
jgi:hypothetical protein